MMGPVLLVTFLVVGKVNGFKINLVNPDHYVVNPGESFTLICGTDSHYERCAWNHPEGNKTCQFAWKPGRWRVPVQVEDCHQLLHRLSFAGHFSKHECGITVASAEMEDTGLWTCQVEQFGSRGTIVTANISVSVAASTTVPPSPATTLTALSPRVTSPSTTNTTIVASLSPTNNTAIVTSATPTTTLTTPKTTQKQPSDNISSTTLITPLTTQNHLPDNISSTSLTTTLTKQPLTTPMTTQEQLSFTMLTTPLTMQNQSRGNNTSSLAAVTEQTTTNKHQETGGELQEPSLVPRLEPQKGQAKKSSSNTPMMMGVLVPQLVPQKGQTQPLPQKGETEKSSSNTPVVVAVLVLLVVLGVAIGVVFYYRRWNVANCAAYYRTDSNDRVNLIQ